MKKKELQPTSILLLLFILYFILYILFVSNKANEADKTLFDTIGNILGLGINAMTIFFVYKTYISQRNQIEDQKKELEANKQDSEFNRALTIIYQQLEYTNKRLSTIKYKTSFQENTIIGFIKNDLNTVLEKNTYDIYNTDLVLKELLREIDFYIENINKHRIDKNKKIELLEIVYWNIGTELKDYLNKLSDIFNMYKGKIDELEPTDEKYIDWYNRYNKTIKLTSYLDGEF